MGLSTPPTRKLNGRDRGTAGSPYRDWTLTCSCLAIHALDTPATVRRLVAFYVQQHNQVMPHWALKGLTPDEVYFGTGSGIQERIKEEHALARDARIKVNRGLTCETCEAGAISEDAGEGSVRGQAA